MKVIIPSQLHSYTGKSPVEARGDTLDTVLADLDRQFPGLRFRIIDEQEQIREHILIVINKEPVCDLHTALKPEDTIRIIGALSGG